MDSQNGGPCTEFANGNQKHECSEPNKSLEDSQTMLESKPYNELSINVEPASSSSSSNSSSPTTTKHTDEQTDKSVKQSPENPQPVVPPPLVSAATTTSFLSEDEPPPTTTSQRQRSVRFRSRVRITSGFHKHRDKTTRPPVSQTTQNNPELAGLFLNPSHSRSSSFSSSPSSSISAPLRSRSDSEYSAGSSASHEGRSWRPLGQRIGLLASERMNKRRERNRRLGLDEHSNLLGGAAPRRYDGFEEDEEETYAVQIAKEIDQVFGTWPGRLLNRHWWWWQLEPVFCCLCMEEEPYD